MSYMSEYRRGQISLKEALKQSAVWLATKAGIPHTDEQIDGLVKEADQLTDALEPQLTKFIAAAVGHVLPQATVDVIAARAASAALEAVDTAIAAAGSYVKAHNGDEPPVPALPPLLPQVN